MGGQAQHCVLEIVAEHEHQQLLFTKSSSLSRCSFQPFSTMGPCRCFSRRAVLVSHSFAITATLETGRRRPLTKRILVVDDQEAMGRLVRGNLEQDGRAVTLMTDTNAALAVIDAGDTFDLHSSTSICRQAPPTAFPSRACWSTAGVRHGSSSSPGIPVWLLTQNSTAGRSLRSRSISPFFAGPSRRCRDARGDDGADARARAGNEATVALWISVCEAIHQEIGMPTH
jgi:CheY-like chemotaxis protein